MGYRFEGASIPKQLRETLGRDIESVQNPMDARHAISTNLSNGQIAQTSISGTRCQLTAATRVEMSLRMHPSGRFRALVFTPRGELP